MAEDAREQTGEWYPTRWPLETPSDPGGSRLEAHLQDRNNPHGVTAEQVGAVTEAQVRDLIASDGSLRPEEFEDLEMGTAKTTKNIYETISRLIRRLKRAAVAVLASTAFSAFGQSVTGEDGKALYELDQEATVILDAPAVKGLLGKKQDALAFDAEPTENGANVVRGGGIWAWVRAQLEGYLPLSGGTLTGPLRTKGVTLGGDVVGTGWTLRMGYIESLGAPRTGNGLIRRADLPAYLLAGDNLTVDVDDGGKLTFSVASFPWGAVTGAPDFLTSESDPTVPAWAKAAAKPAYAYTEVGGLVQQLAAKAAAAHTHAQGDVEGLAAALAGKQDALTAGDNITIEGNVISAAGGASVPIDTTLPDEPTDDHVPSTKLVKDYLLNGKGLINYIYAGSGGFSFMGGESSSMPGGTFDIAPPHGEEKFFRMGEASSEAGLIPVPTKAYVDDALADMAGQAEANYLRKDTNEQQTILGSVLFGTGKINVDAANGNILVSGQMSENGKWLQYVYQKKLTAGEGIVLSEDNVISAAGEGPGPVWVHPGDWTLEAVPLGDSVVSGEASGLSTNAYGQIFAVRSSTLTRGNAVSVRPVPLDALATGVLPEAFTFTLVSGPATLEPEGNAATLTATGNGLAKVSATDGTRTRTVMTSFRSETRVTESAFYHGDVEGSARDAANDAVLAILQARDTSQTVASGITPAVATCDYLYATAGAAPTAYADALPAAPALCAMVDTGVGQYGRRMFAVAPHYALTAAHWDPAPTGRVGRFLAPDGTVATVTATGGVRLRDWALRNGYTAEEAESVWDVYVFTVDGAIPDACVPWVIDQEGVNAHYKGSLKGIACLTVTQNGYLSYTAYADHRGSAWGRPGALRPEDLAEGALDCRDDVAQLLSDSRAAQVYGGDSGLPVFFVHDGKPVVTSLYHTVCAGSSLVGGADILDHYIRAASGGTESLKRIPIPEATEETTP